MIERKCRYHHKINSNKLINFRFAISVLLLKSSLFLVTELICRQLSSVFLSFQAFIVFYQLLISLFVILINSKYLITISCLWFLLLFLGIFHNTLHLSVCESLRDLSMCEHKKKEKQQAINGREKRVQVHGVLYDGVALDHFICRC